LTVQSGFDDQVTVTNTYEQVPIGYNGPLVTVEVERILDAAKGRYITVLPNSTSCHGGGDARVYSAAPVKAQADGGNQGSAASSSSSFSSDDVVSAQTSKVKVTNLGYGYQPGGQLTTVDASSINAAYAIKQGVSYADLTKTVYDSGQAVNSALSQAGALQFAALLADPTKSLEVMDITNEFIVQPGGKAYSQTDFLNTTTEKKDAVNKVGVIPIVNVDKDLQPSTIPNNYLTNQPGFLPLGGSSNSGNNTLLPRSDSATGGSADTLAPDPKLLAGNTQINKYTQLPDPKTGEVVTDTAQVSNQYRLWYTPPDSAGNSTSQVVLRTQPDPIK